jgi:RNA polymerase sigma factor (sigma-70 family)
MSPSISIRLLGTQSDARLLEYASQGHERAFEALVLRYRRQLLSYCRRLLLTEERAEDALQQGLLRAWLALQGGTEVRDPKAWMYRVVHNAALNTLRESGYDYAELHETLSGAGAPEEDLDRRIAVREALAGLAALPELQREALMRTAVEGQSHEAVAAELLITEGALRGLVYRARATLRGAATAVTPSPLITWAASSGGGRSSIVERFAELGAGAGTTAETVGAGAGAGAVEAGGSGGAAGVAGQAGTPWSSPAPAAHGLGLSSSQTLIAFVPVRHASRTSDHGGGQGGRGPGSSNTPGGGSGSNSGSGDGHGGGTSGGGGRGSDGGSSGGGGLSGVSGSTPSGGGDNGSGSRGSGTSGSSGGSGSGSSGSGTSGSGTSGSSTSGSGSSGSGGSAGGSDGAGTTRSSSSTPGSDGGSSTLPTGSSGSNGGSSTATTTPPTATLPGD